MAAGSQADARGGRTGASGRALAWVFVVQFVALAAIGVCAARGLLSLSLAAMLCASACALAWYAVRRAWKPIVALADALRAWQDGYSDPAMLHPARLVHHADADLDTLAQGLHGFATRIADYGERERNFTRDASHELRTPLTVIRMAVDLLGEEQGVSDFGRRSVRRIHRATRELEALVEVLLILARESDPGSHAEHFVVNEVLRREVETARDLMAGTPVELRLDEPASFALHGSVRAFSVLCWQLIRDACQHTHAGSVVVTVLPSSITVARQCEGAASAAGDERLSFELVVAKRISDRFAWPLDLQVAPGAHGMTRVRFPEVLPVAA